MSRPTPAERRASFRGILAAYLGRRRDRCGRHDLRGRPMTPRIRRDAPTPDELAAMTPDERSMAEYIDSETNPATDEPTETHAYRHAPSEDGHEPEPDCPCYYCHGLPAAHQPEPDTADEMAAELEREYAAAIIRRQDRAMEATYGGRILRALTVDPKYADWTPRRLLDFTHALATE